MGSIGFPLRFSVDGGNLALERPGSWRWTSAFDLADVAGGWNWSAVDEFARFRQRLLFLEEVMEDGIWG